MKKSLIQICLALLGFLGIAVLTISMTTFGLSTAIRFITTLVPGELSIKGAQGRFIDHIKANKITYRNKQVSISIDDPELNWRGVRLLMGTLDIRSMTASKISIERFHTTEETHEESPSTISLDQFQSKMISVLVDNLLVESLELDDPQITLNNIQATLAFNEHGLRVRNVEMTHPQGKLELDANIGPAFTPPIKLHAKEQFSFDQIQEILGETTIEGDLNHLVGKQIFTQGLNANLDLDVKNIGPTFVIMAQGRADIDSLHQYEDSLTGEMHVALDLSYDHALGLGKAILKSEKSRVNGKPFELNLDGTIQNHQVTWQDNQFIMGRNTLTTSGEYGPSRKHIIWNLKANQLADISDEMSGQLSSKGQVELNEDSWLSNVQLLAKQVHMGPYAVENLELKPSVIGSAFKQPLSLDLHADQLILDEFLFDNLELKAMGTTDNHLGSIKAQAYNTSLESSGKMKMDGQNEIQILIQDLKLIFADNSQYTLDKPTQIKWVDQVLSVSPLFCLKNDGVSSACLENTQPNHFAVNLKSVPNQLFARYFTTRFRATGQTQAQAQFVLDGHKLDTLSLAAQISPTEIRRGKKSDRIFFEISGSEFQLQIDQNLLTSKGMIGLISPDKFNWDLEVQDWNTLPLATMTAAFKGKITQWDPLRLYITDTNDFSGTVDIDLKAEGKVLEPTYQGSLSLANARLAIPSQGLILQDGNLQITPTKNHQQLEIAGSLRSGEGTVAANGFLSLEDRWPSVDLHLKGERFTLSNTTNAIVFASPDLRIQTEEHRVNISGDFHIPEAYLNVKGYSSYIAPSPDIIIIQENGEVFTPFFEINTRVNLSLGEDISLKASNLDTGIGGQLHLVKLGNAPVRATGQLHGIKGKYAAYGNKLTLSQAVLTFNNSPIDNPAMFIEANRKVQVLSNNRSSYIFADPTPSSQSGGISEGTVGVRITGTVQSPKYTFFSNPSMSEADQLSYLLTGGPSSQIGSAQAAFMFAALTETSGLLGVSDTDAARLQNITRTLGIDFNIESGRHIDAGTGQTINDTNLVVGKALHPRLYVSYTVGLLDPLNMFRVRYQLAPHWAIQSQANSQGDTGGDILYGIETDKFLGIE